MHFGFDGYTERQAAGAARRGRPFRRDSARADRARQRHLRRQCREHLQRHRGGDEARRAQGDRSPPARRPMASASPRATRTFTASRSRRTTTSIRWIPTASRRSATRRPPAPSRCAIGADIYALRIGNVIEPHEYGMFTSFLADPMSRKRNAWSYIDARDLGEIVHLCLQKDGLGFQVFNAINDTITLDTPTRRVPREDAARACRSRANSASSRRRCRTARRARCWASRKRTTGANTFSSSSTQRAGLSCLRAPGRHAGPSGARGPFGAATRRATGSARLAIGRRAMKIGSNIVGLGG